MALLQHLGIDDALGTVVALPWFPVPAPEGMPPAVGGIFLLIGVGVVAVLVWQTVRYFRGPGGPGEP